MAVSVEAPVGSLRSAWGVRAIAGLLVLAGLALAVVRFFGGSEPEQTPSGVLGAVALGAPVAATGVLAWLSLRDRPVLLLPAAIVLVPMSFLSFALVTLPLLVPAAVLVLTYERRSASLPPEAGRAVAAVPVVTMLLFAAVVVLFVHQDPRQFVTSTSEVSTSDVITPLEAIASLLVTALAITVGDVWTRPSRP